MVCFFLPRLCWLLPDCKLEYIYLRNWGLEVGKITLIQYTETVQAGKITYHHSQPITKCYQNIPYWFYYCEILLQHEDVPSCSHMGVSKNKGGPPKSSILIGFSIINHPFWDSPIFGNTHILKRTIHLLQHLSRFPSSPSLSSYTPTFRPSLVSYFSVACSFSKNSWPENWGISVQI